MIRVTVELLPLGNEQRKRTLGTLEICNDATGDDSIGNYEGRLNAEYTDESGRYGRVMQFNRRGQSVWSLIGAFLKLWGHTKHSPKCMSREQPRQGMLWD